MPSTTKVVYAVSRGTGAGTETHKSGATYKVKPQPSFLSRIFVVPKVSTGSRLILDVSVLNENLVIPSVKMSSHLSLRQAFSPDYTSMAGEFGPLDLKNAHLHVHVRRNFHKFLALSCWRKLFYFRVHPFRIATAPRLFTILMNS